MPIGFPHIFNRSQKWPTAGRVAIHNTEPPPPAERDSEPSEERAQHLDHIARASIQLASLGPQLASLAGELEKKAQEQARRAASAAATMLALTADLEKAVAELKAASTQVGGSLSTVEQIALHTRILSLNASVEAARAGVHGRGFAVVVEEVQQLADRTGKTTKEIELRVNDMRSSIVRVSNVTASTSTTSRARTIGAVNREVQGIASLASGQLDGARSLHNTSSDINQLAEQLLLAVGNFRFEAHREAENFVAALLPQLQVSDIRRDDLESIIADWLASNPCFELAYITDGDGLQLVDNLVRTASGIAHDHTAYGRNWSDRPWFSEASSSENIVSTDIYRSAANHCFCFTVSAAVRNDAGELLYVFGADVNFQRLVSR